MIREIRFSKFIEEVPVTTLVDEKGREVLDRRPVAIPLRAQSAPSSMMELMHRLYQQMHAEGKEVETFQDAEDFDVDDEIGIELQDTPYEQNFDNLVRDTAPPAEPSAVPQEPEKVAE